MKVLFFVYIVCYLIGCYRFFKFILASSDKKKRKFYLVVLLLALLAVPVVATYVFKMSLSHLAWNSAIFCTVLIYSIYQAVRVPDVKEVRIKSSKIKEPLTIVSLTDFHINRHSSVRRVRSIVDQTNTLKPDIIVLVGDIIDDHIDKVEGGTGACRELARLSARYGVYFVTGNHEYLYNNARDIVRTLKGYGIQVLENSGQHVGGIYLAGISDITHYKRAKRRKKYYEQADIPNPGLALSEAQDDSYRVLLSHSPMRIGSLGADLVLSGHTHGGQLFPLHLFIKYNNCGYLGGLYNQSEDKKIYVSSGVSQWEPSVRLCSKTEISKIVLSAN